MDQKLQGVQLVKLVLSMVELIEPVRELGVGREVTGSQGPGLDFEVVR